MTHRKALRAQQLSFNMRVHISWLHACDAGCGQPASSINSVLSSSAAVQTWIYGVINLSFQMYDFSTSISSIPCWLLVPSPSNLWSTPTVLTDPHTVGELFAILSIIDLEICGVKWYYTEQQEHWRRNKQPSFPPHHRDEGLYAFGLVHNRKMSDLVGATCQNASQLFTNTHQITY